MLTIDEAIAHARDVARESRGNIVAGNNLEPYEAYCNLKCEECAEEHEQLAEWLKELKMLRELKAEHRKIGNIEGFNKGYNKAIDNFAEKLHHEEFDNEYGVHIVLTPQQVNEIAEQLKVGGEYGNK